MSTLPHLLAFYLRQLSKPIVGSPTAADLFPTGPFGGFFNAQNIFSVLPLISGVFVVFLAFLWVV